MRTMFLILSTLSAMLLFSACATKNESETEKKETQEFKLADIAISETDMKKFGENAIREIFLGIEKNDYAIFRKPFYDKVTNENSFKQLATMFHQENGKLEELKYLDTLQSGVVKASVWKARFSRSQQLIDKLKSEGKNPEKIPPTELLIRLYVGNTDGQWKVFSIAFN